MPKLLTSVTMTSVFGSFAYGRRALKMPKLYQMLWYFGSSAAGVVPPR